MHDEWIKPTKDVWGFEYEIYSPDEKEIEPDNTEKMAKMTDGNDNLVDIDDADDWKETAGGHYRGEIDIDDDTIDALIETWARSNLDDASYEQYEEVKAAEGRAAGLHSGILNTILIDAMKESIARHEEENANS